MFLKKERLLDGSYKTTYFYRCVDVNLGDNVLKQLKKHQLPLVVEPRDWSTDAQGGMNFGGFICGRLLAYPGVHFKSSSGTTMVDEKLIRAINILQKNRFRTVENPELFSVRGIYRRIVEGLKRKAFRYEIISLIGDVLTILPFSQTTYASEGELGKVDYGVQFNQVFEFLDTVVIAYAYRGFDFYNSYYIDSRGRAYALGYPFSNQGNKFSREYIEF